MKLPLKICRLDSETLRHNWNTRFADERRFTEVVWRRHQAQENKALSGWRSERDQRRRLLHIRDEYDMVDNHFVLKSPYLFLHVRNTRDKIAAYDKNVKDVLYKQWDRIGSNKFRQGDLTCHVVHSFYMADAYHDFSVRIYPTWEEPTDEVINRPWEIFKLGIRSVEPRGNPRYIDIKEVKNYLPAQIELGCGPSTEAGVVPLHFLHRVYSIMKPDYTFVFNPEDDCITNFLSNPLEKYHTTTSIRKSCLTAEPTEFYYALKTLVERDLIIQPIITNNFDGIPASMGLQEYYLRRFDKECIYPEIEFDPKAKSLLVIGSHADRRGVVRCARKKGLPIIFIDPEGFADKDYPLESPQDNDLIVKQPASCLKQLVL